MRNIKKVQLVIPDEHKFEHLPEGWWSPLGILYVGTYLKQQHPDIEVEILDGRFMEESELESRILKGHADIVGFSTSNTNYPNVLNLAKKAKNENPSLEIILGGPHASSHAENIIEKRPFIDAVVYNDGEISFERLVTNGINDSVPNLVYIPGKSYEDRKRDIQTGADIKQQIRRTVENIIDIKKIPFPDFSLYKEFLPKAWADFWRAYPQYKGERIVSAMAIRGCPRRGDRIIEKVNREDFENKYANIRNAVVLYDEQAQRVTVYRGCTFCSRGDRKYRRSDVQQYAMHLKQLQDDFGIARIEETTDSYMDLEFLREFVKYYEEYGLKIKFSVFARADGIVLKEGKVNTELLDILKRINVYHAFIGYESGKQEILDNMNKGETVSQMVDATRLLRRQGIGVTSAFILGTRGETEESLEASFKLAKQIIKKSPIVEWIANYSIQSGIYEKSKVAAKVVDYLTDKFNLGVDTVSFSIFTPLFPSPESQMIKLSLNKVTEANPDLTDPSVFFEDDTVSPLDLQRWYVNAYSKLPFNEIRIKYNEFQRLVSTGNISAEYKPLE